MINILPRNFPSSPGVYLFKENFGKVLYVGKAINLKKRVQSYFKNKKLELRISKLLEKASKVDYIATKTEIQTLLLEANLIKQYQPKYNIQLKDSKRYLYAGISKERYSRVYLLRQPEIDKGLLDWWGPFPTAQSLKEVFRYLRRIFPYRSCVKMPKKACLYYHLKLCPGVCENKIPEKEYKKSMAKIRVFLTGKVDKLLNILKKEMNSDAQSLQYENAQIKKYQIESIGRLLNNFKKLPEDELIEKQLAWLRNILIKYQGVEPMVLNRIEGYDISNLGKKIVVGSMVVFSSGESDKTQYRQYKVRTKSGGDPEALKEVLKRRLKHEEWVFPQLILVDGGKPQLSAAIAALHERGLGKHVGLIGLTKEKETIIVPFFEKGRLSFKKIRQSSKTTGLALLQNIRDESHRFAQRYYKKLHRKAMFFSLPK